MVIAVVQIPLWTLPVAFLICCWIPDSVRLLWTCLCKVGGRVAGSRGRRHVGVGGESDRTSPSVSRGLTAITGADIYPWPRVTVYQHTGEPKDAA